MATKVRRAWITLALLFASIATVALATGRLELKPGRAAPSQRPVSLGSAAAAAPGAGAAAGAGTPASGAATQQSASPATAPGVGISCVDVGSGVAFEYFAQHLLGTGVLDSAWSGAGPRLCLGTTDDLHQLLCPDGAGGVFAGWVDARRGDTDIYLQHFDSLGIVAQGWPANGMAVCVASWSQYNLDLAPDGAGGVFLVWQDFRDRGAGDIYGQHVLGSGELADGWAQGGSALCADSHAQSYPRVAADTQGGCYVVWEDRRDGPTRLYALRIDGSGAPRAGWPATGASLTSGTGDDHMPRLASTGAGRVAVVFRADGSSGSDVRLQHLGSDDSPAAAWPPSAITLSAGLAEVSDIAVVPDNTGGELVAWSEWREDPPTLRLQHLTADAAVSTGWPAGGAELCTSALGVNAPRVLALPDSTTIVGWEDFRSGSCDVYAQRLSAAGEVVSGWPEGGVAVRAGVGEQYAPSLVADGSGGVFVAWADASTGTQAGFMGAQAALATQIRLVRSNATPGRAHLVWAVPRGVRGLEAQRRLADEGEWMKIGTPAPDDSGQVSVEDRDAPEGATLEYRLALSGEDFIQLLPAVRLTIPVAPLRLALHRAWAIAPQNVIALSLALPRGAPPSVDLLDVMGRRVQRQSFPGLEPGEQVLRMAISSRLASGVYFIRLTQGPESRSTKVVLIR